MQVVCEYSPYGRSSWIITTGDLQVFHLHPLNFAYSRLYYVYDHTEGNLLGGLYAKDTEGSIKYSFRKWLKGGYHEESMQQDQR